MMDRCEPRVMLAAWQVVADGLVYDGGKYLFLKLGHGPYAIDATLRQRYGADIAAFERLTVDPEPDITDGQAITVSAQSAELNDVATLPLKDASTRPPVPVTTLPPEGPIGDPNRVLEASHTFDKLDTTLGLLALGISPKSTSDDEQATEVLRSSSVVVNDTVLVQLLATSQKSVTELDQRVQEIGGKVQLVSQRDIVATVPISMLSSLNSFESLQRATHAFAATDTGVVDSEGDTWTAFDSETARNSFALTGDNVQVGVISDSYNVGGGAATDVQNGELPGIGNPAGRTTPVNVVSDSATGSNEGRAMLQIVHDVAPDADLSFHAGGGTRFTAAAAIERMAGLTGSPAINNDIIVDDLFYPDEPFYQDGAMSDAISRARAAGVTYVTSAGNAGTEAYETLAPFQQSTTWDIPGFGVRTVHDFNPGAGTDPFQAVWLEPNASFVLSLQWAEPFASNPTGPGADSNLDFYIFNGAGTAVEWSEQGNDVNGDPVDYTPTLTNGPTGRYINVMVARTGTSTPSRFKYIIRSPNQGADISEFATNSSTIIGKALSNNALVTAAANAAVTPAAIETFSSRGGGTILFDSNGNPINQARSVPYITGPDGVATSVPGFSPFFGTSAAAPHLAGLAALMWQARDRNASVTGIPWSDTQITDAIFENLALTATDIDTGGFPDDAGSNMDRASGYGMAFGPSAVARSLTARTGTGTLAFAGTPNGDNVVFTVTNSGTRLNATFNGATFNYRLGSGSTDITRVNVDIGSGNDYIEFPTSYTRNSTVLTASGNDTIYGGDGIDSIAGGADNDRVFGRAGNDILLGAAGNDSIEGGDGADSIQGDGGDDTIKGLAGADSMYGNDGNDLFDAVDSFADSVINGGTGTDTAFSDNPEDPLSILVSIETSNRV
ncbi:MAG: S8 family serine peptidase [Tepidisphaeraceae bacterium]